MTQASSRVVVSPSAPGEVASPSASPGARGVLVAQNRDGSYCVISAAGKAVQVWSRGTAWEVALHYAGLHVEARANARAL